MESAQHLTAGKLNCGGTEFRYTPYYCEENIWHLCQHPKFARRQVLVVFISNDKKSCPFFFQRACPSLQRPVWWDYHVILLCKEASWLVWDLDTILGCPISMEDYLRLTFGDSGTISKEYAPLFRIVTPDKFVHIFSSNRSHMRKSNGQWIALPPPWPAIYQNGRNTLNEFIVMASNKTRLGVVSKREALEAILKRWK